MEVEAELHDLRKLSDESSLGKHMKAVENLETNLLATIWSHGVLKCLVYPGAQTTSYCSNPICQFRKRLHRQRSSSPGRDPSGRPINGLCNE